MSGQGLILASQSESRRRMLAAAGIPHRALRSPLDEEEEKARLRDDSVPIGAEMALRLAQAKACAVAGAGDDLVLGCDQLLVTDDGTMLDKADSLATLAFQLRALSGRTHVLHSAAAIVQRGVVIWQACEPARMTMRTLSDRFIADYLAHEGEALLGCVGGYRIEQLGAQLFSAVDGNSFVVQGLPMFPLLDFLRQKAVLSS